MQRHFKSEDHTEFTVYLLLIGVNFSLCVCRRCVCVGSWMDRCHNSRSHFRHISRDSWRVLMSRTAKENRWLSQFGWKFSNEIPGLALFVIQPNQICDVRNEFCCKNLSIAQNWGNVAGPSRMICNALTFYGTRKGRRGESEDGKNRHIVCATVRHRSRFAVACCTDAYSNGPRHALDLRWKQEANLYPFILME